MKLLYAPWRSEYITDASASKENNIKSSECTFCIQFSNLKKDEEHFILKRTKYNVILLNKFPYNAGHLLIIPLKHTSSLEKLPKIVRSEIMELINQSIIILKKNLGAHGINVGLNLEKAAGASIVSHIHFHILPRWTGDTNFLPTLTHTKQISFDLKTVFEQLKKAFI